MTDHPPALDKSLERLAQRSARAKMAWYAHASVYLLVNAFLAFLSARSSHSWALFPALGWGLGLLVHGVAVWVALPGGTLYAQLLERERARLQRQRRP